MSVVLVVRCSGACPNSSPISAENPTSHTESMHRTHVGYRHVAINGLAPDIPVLGDMRVILGVR